MPASCWRRITEQNINDFAVNCKNLLLHIQQPKSPLGAKYARVSPGWLRLPIPAANFLDHIVNAVRRRLFPIWDPLENPVELSISLYDKFDNHKPVQLSHDITL